MDEEMPRTIVSKRVLHHFLLQVYIECCRRELKVSLCAEQSLALFFSQTCTECRGVRSFLARTIIRMYCTQSPEPGNLEVA